MPSPFALTNSDKILYIYPILCLSMVTRACVNNPHSNSASSTEKLWFPRLNFSATELRFVSGIRAGGSKRLPSLLPSPGAKNSCIISQSEGAICQTDIHVSDGTMGLINILNGDLGGQTSSF